MSLISRPSPSTRRLSMDKPHLSLNQRVHRVPDHVSHEQRHQWFIEWLSDNRIDHHSFPLYQGGDCCEGESNYWIAEFPLLRMFHYCLTCRTIYREDEVKHLYCDKCGRLAFNTSTGRCRYCDDKE